MKNTRRHPRVSLIIPIYNGDRFLSECIESVLNQTYRDFELILINDGSEDHSYNIAAGYAAIDDRIILLSHERNLGVVNALNQGLQRASGRLIARLDQDDIAFPHRLKEQVAFMESHQEVVLLGSMMIMISSDGETVGRSWWCPETDCQIRFGLLFNNRIADPSVVYRAEIVRNNGLQYDPLYVGAEDYQFWVNVLKYGCAYSIPEPLVKYRHHENQMSRKYAVQQEQSAERISSKLISEFDPSLKLSSIERKILDTMYTVFLTYYSSDHRVRNGHSLQDLQKPESFGDDVYQQTLKNLIAERTLQEMAGKFVSRYQSTDDALITLKQLWPE